MCLLFKLFLTNFLLFNNERKKHEFERKLGGRYKDLEGAREEENDVIMLCSQKLKKGKIAVTISFYLTSA